MQGHLIDLTDGTRLEVKVNFGTIYYLQKARGYRRIAKKVEKKKELTESESLDMAANIIYALLRSNGKKVEFEEALSLVPPDAEQIEKVLSAFQEEYEKYSKKKQAEKMPAR
mgnify:CR=1 FL=1